MISTLWQRLPWLLTRVTAAGVALAAALLAAQAYETHRYRLFHDPSHVPDLQHFVQHYGLPHAMEIVAVGQNRYYRVVAPPGDFRVTVSGPPVFFYDTRGRLWDYTLDSGDVALAETGLDAYAASFRLVRKAVDPQTVLRGLTPAPSR